MKKTKTTKKDKALKWFALGTDFHDKLVEFKELHAAQCSQATVERAHQLYGLSENLYQELETYFLRVNDWIKDLRERAAAKKAAPRKPKKMAPSFLDAAPSREIPKPIPLTEDQLKRIESAAARTWD